MFSFSMKGLGVVKSQGVDSMTLGSLIKTEHRHVISSVEMAPIQALKSYMAAGTVI